MMNNARPGLLTTEFWITLAANVLAIAVLVGAITPDVAAKYQAWVQAAAALIVAVVTAVYSHSRAKVKAAAIAAGR